MTSTLYHRGFGSRMENPVIALYVDGIPVLDKNAYDIDFLDIASVRFYRGSQGTLYGRNALTGVLEVRTPSPSESPRWQGQFEWGSAGTVDGRLSRSWDGQTLSAGFRRSDGFFVNSFDGSRCDPYTGFRLRHKLEKRLRNDLCLTNSLSLSFSDEGGYAYRRYLDGEIHPVNHNDACGYRRLYLSEGASLFRDGPAWILQATGSVQLLLDRMRMDQDYTPLSIFTLEQRQRLAGTTLEMVARPKEHPDWWHPVTGAFLLLKYNRMGAPVEFLPDGVQTLILDNANRNIPEEIGFLAFEEDRFTIGSEFGILTWNAALFHESAFTAGPWRLTAGLRLDYEGARMAYDSKAAVHYRFVPVMAAFKAFPMTFQGHLVQHHPEILPKLSVLYKASEKVRLYGSAARGHRAGGFNTQIFSDILQSRMMLGLMEDLGVHFGDDRPVQGSENTQYKPEDAVTFELGVRLSRWKDLSGGINVFRTDCWNQQLTVFPPGQSTGRLMTNAGRSRSVGVEAEAAWNRSGWAFRGAGGWNRATFVEYADGNADYASRHLPYAPSWTLFLSGNYRFEWSGRAVKALEMGVSTQGTGTIWWNEANTLSQEPYFLVSAHVSLSAGRFTAYVRTENLLDQPYRTFYFKSMGNSFFSEGKPARAVVGLSFYFQ